MQGNFIEKITELLPLNSSISWGNLLRNSLSQDKDIFIKIGGKYKCEAQHPISFCKASLSFEIDVDTIAPIANVNASDITCKNNLAFIDVNTNQNNSFDFQNTDIIVSSNNQYATALAGKKLLTIEGQNGCIANVTFEIKADTLKPYYFAFQCYCSAYVDKYTIV